MKKWIVLMAALLIACSACADEVVLPAFEWERDGANHWQIDEDGARINESAHELNDMLFCTVCGSEVLVWEGYGVSITDYDEYGNVLRHTDLDANGAVNVENVHIYEYNNAGIVLADREYYSNGFRCETIYAVNADGEQVPVSSTAWNDDGTVSINSYDEYGNCVRSAIFEADGTVSYENICEYALDADGWYYEAKTTSRFASGATFYTEHNEYGDKIREINTEDDGTVWSDEAFEYEYNSETGYMVWCKQYSFGELAWEEFCDENGFIVQEIEYLEDGIRIVYDYDSRQDMICATTYLADGSIGEVTAFEYEYTTYVYEEEEYSEERLTGKRMYFNDVLAMETVYNYNEMGGCIGYVETNYAEDGTRLVCEYDIFGELISEKTIAAE